MKLSRGSHLDHWCPEFWAEVEISWLIKQRTHPCESKLIQSGCCGELVTACAQ